MSPKPALLLLFLAGGMLCGEDATKEVINRVAARLDLANSEAGSVPGGATVVVGTWSIDDNKRLTAAPEPILDNWLEFGPEIREKSATVVAAGSCPGGETLKSRFGIGLYGKNGVQLRFVPGRRQLELVRRGETLAKIAFLAEADAVIHLELTADSERGNWRFLGRAWIEGTERPEAPLVQHQLFPAELLFPVAGRAVLVATPFSGKPVDYREATVYHGTWHPDAESAPEKTKEPEKK